MAAINPYEPPADGDHEIARTICRSAFCKLIVTLNALSHMAIMVPASVSAGSFLGVALGIAPKSAPNPTLRQFIVMAVTICLGLYAYNVARLELKTFAVYSPPQERLRCGLMSLMAIAPLLCSSLAPKGMFLDVSLPTRGVFFCAALLSICWLGLSALRYARFRST